MRKNRVDYRGLRLSNITKPQYRHLLLLLGWVGYFFLYYLTENLISREACHVIHCPLDDRIPFCEFFVVFYVLWYALIVLSLGYFLLYNVRSFKKLQTYIILVQVLATIVYVFYPSRQELRPEIFPRQNIFTAIIAFLYHIDTPTGVFPSLHVAISFGIMGVWLGEGTAKLWVRIAVALFCIGVCLSVAFVKQHSVLDILGAVPISLMAQWMIRRIAILKES